MHGLSSVDISEWDTPGTFVPKCANDCTPEEIKLEGGKNADEQLLTDELLTGASRVDELLDRVRAADWVDGLLSRLGVH